jgi:hypothetical protein
MISPPHKRVAFDNAAEFNNKRNIGILDTSGYVNASDLIACKIIYIHIKNHLLDDIH